MFQSSPLIAEGRYLEPAGDGLHRGEFQSSPLIAEGRYMRQRDYNDFLTSVSILAPHR